jgi:hypothetical protein
LYAQSEAITGACAVQIHYVSIAMKTQLVVSLSDLRYVEIECPACHAKVTLDMKRKSEFGEKYDFFTPAECPGCTTKYDTAIQGGIDSFRKSYLALTSIADRVSFRGPMEDKV